ncbi:hypothetical protein IDH44_21740 [Paenibacillus sp. IB182496]|uniref:Uncharacterized protein n=1 Tax=Paenibacillus sabuli TaxID=2772509 RepID=A0A927BY93_9BACL|nr:hypothetical protein [Paenibacillus sabuli]MBD2847825.1 hypothetical protein [Paenibacillus sabuli]
MQNWDIRLASQVEAPELAIAPDKRLPFGWRAIPVQASGGAATGLYWKADADEWTGTSARLRVTVALDVREEKRIEVLLTESKTAVGELDIRYAYVFQPFELLLDQAAATAALREGLSLRMTKGEQPLWLFFEPAAPQPSTLYVPHLLLDSGVAQEGRLDAGAGSAAARQPHPQPQSQLQPGETEARREAFLTRMLSYDSIQEYSWMGGCVLDGLLALTRCASLPAGMAPQATIEAQLALFYDAHGGLRYENPRSEPMDGRVCNIEMTLPFAIVAQVWPDHPSLAVALDFWLGRAEADEENVIQDGDTLSAEGSYTIAYPLAVLARLRADGELAELAGGSYWRDGID